MASAAQGVHSSWGGGGGTVVAVAVAVDFGQACLCFLNQAHVPVELGGRANGDIILNTAGSGWCIVRIRADLQLGHEHTSTNTKHNLLHHLPVHTCCGLAESTVP